MKCEIHADKVNADSDMRNKQTHHGNDRDGSRDVATVPATVSAAAAAATVLFAYAISISRQLQSPDACQTQCKQRRRSCHRTNLPLDCPSPLPLSHIERLLTTAHKANANANARQRAFILDIKRKRI